MQRLSEFFTVNMLEDLRLSFRHIRRARLHSLTVIATLALCLGANGAIFAVVYSVLLRPLPLPDADRIVAFADQFPTIDPNFSLLNNVRSYFDRPQAVPAVQNQAMFRTTRRAIGFDNQPEQIAGLEVTASFFDLVRTYPALGQGFTDADSEIGNEQKIILSHALWQRAFGAEPGVIGRDIELDGRQYTVVGVMGAGFSFFDPNVQFWMPLAFTTAQRQLDNGGTRLLYRFYHMGRLAPGASVAVAQSQTDALNAANLERFPNLRDIWVNARFHTIVMPLREVLVRDISRVLYLMWGGAAFVLLIGAINVTNITVARANVRGRELATRVALGASPVQVTRLLTIESVVLAIIGGVAGLGVSAAILRTIQSLGLDAVPNMDNVELGLPVVAFMLGAAVLVGALVGIWSAAGLSAPNLGRALGEGSRGGTRGRGARALRRGLVVAQIGMSVALLVSVGLLLFSFRNLLRTDPGFEDDGVLTAGISLPVAGYPDDAAIRNFTERFLGAVRAIPGVASAGLTSNIPFGTEGGWGPIIAEDYEAAPGESVVSPWRVLVTPGYLEAMGTTILRGRGFEERDREGNQRVMLVDERLAKRFWGDRDPIGTRMFMPTNTENLNFTDANTEFYTVVGIVRDSQLRDLAGRGARAFGTQYLPHRQWPDRTFYLAIKTLGDPGRIMDTLRQVLRDIDPRLPMFDTRMMTDRTDASLGPRRLALGLASMFGATALSLAALGIYGVLAFLVAQRRREIGIRLALGSSRTRVFGLVLWEGMWLTFCGLVVGIVVAVIVGYGLREQLFGITPYDPLLLATVAVFAGAIAVLASVSPARQATQVDPVVTLTHV
jgi:predicted permease